MDPNTKLDLFKDKKDVMKEPSSSGGRKSRHVISSSVGHSPYQKRPSKAEQSPLKDTTRDNSCLALDPNINPDLSEDNKDVMTSEQLIQTHSLNRRFPSQDTSVDDSHLTQDANTGQDKDKTEASSHFTPELLKEPGAISYRFTCPGPGVFRCMLTKLVFTMDREGELLYRTVQWDENRLQSAGKRPAGPLFNIKCSKDAVSKLHLPHCEIKPAPLCLSVVHISDDGMSFLEPLEITDTHVVVDVPHLSAFGLVLDIIKRFFNPDPEPKSGQVLLFRPPTEQSQPPKLNVFLLPDNVLVQEVKGQHENAEYIVVPSSCDLIEGQTYSLHCSEAHEVQPKCARFKSKYGPNYHPTFDIRLTPSSNEANMKVQDQEKREVWKYHIKLTGSCSTSISASSSPPPATQPSASQPTWFPVTAEEGGLDPRRENLQRSLSGDKERRLLSVRTEFIDRVSSSVLKDLLDALLQHRVINNREMESIQIMPSRADKARELIDTVLKKGNRACEILMDTFCEVDPFVSTMLNLQ